jgi:hypothetical protein
MQMQPRLRKTLRVYEDNDFHHKYNHLYVFGFIKTTRPTVPAYCTVVGIDAILNDLDPIRKVNRVIFWSDDYA